MATEYENNHSKIIADNNTLKQKCSKLEESLENKEKDLILFLIIYITKNEVYLVKKSFATYTCMTVFEG